MYSKKIADFNIRCSGLPFTEGTHLQDIRCPYISTMQECFKAPKILTSPKQLYSKFLNSSTEVPQTSEVRTCNIQMRMHTKK